MLTKRPDIVIAHAPKRSTRRKAKAAAMPKALVIVEARDPRRIKRKKPARSVVDHGKGADLTEDEMRQHGEAADRLWQEIKRAVAESTGCTQDEPRRSGD